MARTVLSRVFCLALVVGAWPANAASVRTFVASTGTDSGACSRAAPCRSFAYAVSQTSNAGEVDVLDSAGYGPVTLTQSISIINSAGNTANIAVPSNQNGITISAAETDNIVLRGLTLEGGKVGSNGIVFNSGASLTVSECSIQNFSGVARKGNGILLQPETGAVKIAVSNTSTSGNQNYGIYYAPTATGTAAANIAIDTVAARNNTSGIRIENTTSSAGAVVAAITSTIASSNSVAGFYFTSSSGLLRASISSSTAMGSQYGLFVAGAANAYLGQSVIIGNGTGVYTQGGAAAYTYKNNQIDGNTQGSSGQFLTTTLQ